MIALLELAPATRPRRARRPAYDPDRQVVRAETRMAVRFASLRRARRRFRYDRTWNIRESASSPQLYLSLFSLFPFSLVQERKRSSRSTRRTQAYIHAGFCAYDPRRGVDATRRAVRSGPQMYSWCFMSFTGLPHLDSA